MHNVKLKLPYEVIVSWVAVPIKGVRSKRLVSLLSKANYFPISQHDFSTKRFYCTNM